LAFAAWLKDLRDRRAAIAIVRRIDYVGRGNLGDARSVGSGVSELRLDVGPGYRLYFIRRGQRLIVLLCGGDKDSQARDIQRAKAMAEGYDAS
jgi:putative addiction module killer protein